MNELLKQNLNIDLNLNIVKKNEYRLLQDGVQGKILIYLVIKKIKGL
jgi:hypothetical protein